MPTLNPHQDIAAGKRNGFTLVELLITLVISSFIVAAIYTAYRVNQRHYSIQSRVIEMQQNIRAAIYTLNQELRMAGYDPTGNADSGFVTAAAGRVQFTKDITDDPATAADGDGDTDDTNENVWIGFQPSDDATADGVADSGAASVGISYDNWATFSAIADDIAAIEFNYILEDGTETLAPTPVQLDEIRSVTVTLLARSKHRDDEFTNSKVYTRGSGNTWGPANDNYRRRLLTSNVQCRNMGL